MAGLHRHAEQRVDRQSQRLVRVLLDAGNLDTRDLGEPIPRAHVVESAQVL